MVLTYKGRMICAKAGGYEQRQGMMSKGRVPYDSAIGMLTSLDQSSLHLLSPSNGGAADRKELV